MWDKLKTALVLMLIGAFSGFAIYYTNELTKDPIRINRENKEKGFYQEIFGLDDVPDFDKETLSETYLEEEVIVYDANNNVLGYIYKGADVNSYGDIDVLVGITIEGKVSQVVISSSDNTPNFVFNIKSNYLGNFDDQSVDDLSYDASTGASFTYGSVSNIVSEASTYYLENRGDTDE